jgi:hypothetical protein
MFQTSITNGNTVVQALPNGTGSTSGFRVFNSSDAGNASTGEMVLSSTIFNINAGNTGTGTYLPMTFQTSGTERMRITTAGVVELTSGQLKFPASQNASADANTLDDYEEGTWTPTISIEGGSGALSATSIYDARYTKIGRLVHVTCDVAWSNYYANGGTGAVLFTGLPFAYAKGGTQGEGQLMQGGYWTSSNITGSRFSSELIWHTFFNTSGSTGGYIKYKESSTDRGSYLALGGGPLGTGSGSLVFQFEFTYVAAT